MIFCSILCFLIEQDGYKVATLSYSMRRNIGAHNAGSLFLIRLCGSFEQSLYSLACQALRDILEADFQSIVCIIVYFIDANIFYPKSDT